MGYKSVKAVRKCKIGVDSAKTPLKKTQKACPKTQPKAEPEFQKEGEKCRTYGKYGNLFGYCTD